MGFSEHFTHRKCFTIIFVWQSGYWKRLCVWGDLDYQSLLLLLIKLLIVFIEHIFWLFKSQYVMAIVNKNWWVLKKEESEVPPSKCQHKYFINWNHESNQYCQLYEFLIAQ